MKHSGVITVFKTVVAHLVTREFRLPPGLKRHCGDLFRQIGVEPLTQLARPYHISEFRIGQLAVVELLAIPFGEFRLRHRFTVATGHVPECLLHIRLGQVQVVRWLGGDLFDDRLVGQHLQHGYRCPVSVQNALQKIVHGHGGVIDHQDRVPKGSDTVQVNGGANRDAQEHSQADNDRSRSFGAHPWRRDHKLSIQAYK